MKPPRFMDGLPSHQVLISKKMLNGLKESPRIQYKSVDREMEEVGSQPLLSATLVLTENDEFGLFYADDFLKMGKYMESLKAVQKSLGPLLPSNDFGEAVHYLRVKVVCSERVRTLLQ